MEVMERLGRRCEQLRDDIKERRGYGKLNEEALAHSLVESLLWKRLCTCHK
jgi:hypothetical protein